MDIFCRLGFSLCDRHRMSSELKVQYLPMMFITGPKLSRTGNSVKDADTPGYVSHEHDM